MDDAQNASEELKREAAYYKRQLDQMSGESIRQDYILTSLRQELKQKKDAFALLTMLQQQFTVTTPVDTLLSETIKAINTKLGMDRSAVLVSSGVPHLFKLSHWYGYPQGHFNEQASREVRIDKVYLQEGRSLLVTKNALPDETGIQIRNNLSITYFVGVPVLHDEKPIAFIVSGRQIERLPFSPALNSGDVDTLTAITRFISTLFQHKKTIALQVAKAEIEKENETIAAQRDVLEKTLLELRNTQAQLIQSEKMASLGEITAGIAHEIQNPLNFVNNFAEANTELIDELKQEARIGNTGEVIAISNCIEENEKKIIHHGKRADAIVKSMLQHSRRTDGVKEQTDINVLAEEYLKLAYHGFRAKHKEFTAVIQTQFSEVAGPLSVVQQDLGRVLLNLFNNAFHAVQEKKRQLNGTYEPIVLVSTKREGDKILITVKDNGTGMSPKVADKIFQPFFTTKPTGEGTGLGLSLSYDIITKGHGGELKVESKEGEGAEFIIHLPIT